jgi:hypothetical protein
MDRIDGEAQIVNVSTSKNEYKWDQRELSRRLRVHFLASLPRKERFGTQNMFFTFTGAHLCSLGDVELLVPFYTLLDTYSFLDRRQALHPTIILVSHTFLT